MNEYCADATEMPDRVHVYPLFGKEHVASCDCWCQPKSQADEPRLLIHHVEH